jgi:hypothetical protein
MDFEQSLRAELVTVTNLSSKVFPLFAPEGTSPPFVAYQKTRTNYTKTMDGTQSLRDGYYQFDLLATNYAALQTLYTNVVEKLLSFRGRTIGTNGVYVQNVTIENAVELYEPLPDWHRMHLEIKFYF